MTPAVQMQVKMLRGLMQFKLADEFRRRGQNKGAAGGGEDNTQKYKPINPIMSVMQRI
jgi:hypothetical protein